MLGTTTRALHAYLRALQGRLDAAAEPTLARATGSPPDLRPLVEEHLPAARAHLDDAYAALTRLDEGLSPEQRAGGAALHRMLVQPFFLGGPLHRWAIDKPLGYPGDYRMVEHLFDYEPTGHAPLGALLDRWGFETGPARAHRARRAWALEHVRAAAARAPARPLHLLSFACGPERVLRDLPAGDRSHDITLCDVDPRALEHAERHLRAALGPDATIRSKPLSAYALLRDPAAARSLASPATAAAGGFDVVLVLGLLDYMPAAAIRRFLAALRSTLRPGGLLLLTNLRAGNPWRSYMELLLEWPVEHRSPDEFAGLVADDGHLETLSLAPDPASGTNLFYVGRRP